LGSGKFRVSPAFARAPRTLAIGLAYRSRERETPVDVLEEFKEADDAPVGFLLAGDTVRDTKPVEHRGDGVVKLPYRLYLLLR
jgi:hypothetical protein